MVAITVILAAVIAAFVFGLAGTTSTSKTVAMTVTLNEDGYGVVTAQGGADLPRMTYLTYTIDGKDPSGATPATGIGYWFDSDGTAQDATDPVKWNVGKVYYTGNETASAGDVIQNHRFILIGKFGDGSTQVLFDKNM